MAPRQPVEDEAPPFPEVVAYLWGWFNEIIAGVPAGGMGPQVMTWSDLRAWADLTGEAVEPWEARALVRLGITRASVLSEEATKKHGAANKGRADRPVRRGRRP
jgi:hypothetical protein